MDRTLIVMRSRSSLLMVIRRFLAVGSLAVCAVVCSRRSDEPPGMKIEAEQPSSEGHGLGEDPGESKSASHEWVDVEIRVRVIDREGTVHVAENGSLRVRIVAPETRKRDPERSYTPDRGLPLELSQLGYLQPPGASFQFDTDFEVSVEQGVGRFGSFTPGYVAARFGHFQGKGARVRAPSRPVAIDSDRVITIDVEIE